MMGMRLEIRQRLALVCTTCGLPCDEHDPNCPQHLIEQALENEPTYDCARPSCAGVVQVAADDFLKCRTCRNRYSLGEISDTSDPVRVHLHRVRPDEDSLPAYLLAARGAPGGFALDLKIRALRAAKAGWKARLRDEKAAARRARKGARSA